MPVYHDELKTLVENIEYDFERQVGYVNVPKDCCTDMGGCIALFQRIDPNVDVIVTFAGREKDTMYFRDRERGWEAELPNNVVVPQL